MSISPRLYLLFIFFLLFSSTTYISFTSTSRLKGHPFNWNADNIHLAGVILLFIQFFSIFLGGFLAAFVIPVSILLGISFASLLAAIIVIEVAVKDQGNSTLDHIKNDTDRFLDQDHVISVVAFYVLFGIYSGLSKFILLVTMLDQDDQKSMDDTIMYYIFTLNLSIVFIFGFVPPIKENDLYLTLSLPAVLIAAALLIIGRWKNLYSMKQKQINIIEILLRQTVKRDHALWFSRERNDNKILVDVVASTSTILSSSSSRSNLTLLSFSKLCIIFISLLPYGICESQVRTTFIIQSNYLQQPTTNYYAFKDGFWVQIINCVGVLVIIFVFKFLRRFCNWFDKIYSRKIWKIIVGNLFILLSILSAAIVESIRLRIYWYSNRSHNHKIDYDMYNVTDMSVFSMTPQLLFSSISEILILTTCTEFLFKQSLDSMKYLSIAFLLGAMGSGGAGDLISLGLTFPLKHTLFDITDLNKRILSNGTCCSFQSRMDYWFYILIGLHCLCIIASAVLLRKFKHYYEPDDDKSMLQDG